jgi:hypothetical protein
MFVGLWPAPDCVLENEGTVVACHMPSTEHFHAAASSLDSEVLKQSIVSACLRQNQVLMPASRSKVK